VSTQQNRLKLLSVVIFFLTAVYIGFADTQRDNQADVISIENNHYVVEVASKNGAIRLLRDKASKMELLADAD